MLVSVEICFNCPEKEPLKIVDVINTRLVEDKFIFTIVEGYDIEIPCSKIRTWSTNNPSVRGIVNDNNIKDISGNDYHENSLRFLFK